MSVRAVPVALTIAGSDSGGGAGIQADLKTFQWFGVFGTSAITAVTAQNTEGVRAVEVLSPEIVRLQIEAVAGDLSPDACKTGMLASHELVDVVAASLETLDCAYVLDPVMVASSGDRLLDVDAEDAIRTRLLPLCTLVTPNLDEAAVLTGAAVSTRAGMERAARALVDLGAGAALVKGGHLPGAELVDVFFDGERMCAWSRPKLATRNTHGTGCTLSAAIAAWLARGADLSAAVENALEYVQRALASAPGLGSGRGPLNHSPPAGGPRQAQPTMCAD